jgi:glycosyltransferase involved in cell wall biosynthesis
MRIALIAPTHIPARRANTIQVMKMAQAMTALGHDVLVFSPSNSSEQEREKPSWEALARHYGLKYQFALQWLFARPWLRRYDYGLIAIRRARRWQADLIYTRLPQAAALASLLGHKTINEVHDLPQGTLGPKLFRLFLRGKGARRVVVITKALQDDLFPAGNPPVEVIIAPDGVDLARYADLPDSLEARRRLLARDPVPEALGGLEPKRFTLGYTGHLYAGRGVELILDIARRLPAVQCLLVGGEPNQVSHVRDQLRVGKLNNVFLTGFVPNAELPLYQAASDALLMPYQHRVSASSGGDIATYLSPMKLFEYMACGRPILSSDLPVLGEILTSENAICLPPDDVDAWVSTVQALHSNPDRCRALGDQARKEVKSYTWRARSERILKDL